MPEPPDATLLKPSLRAPEESPAAEFRSRAATTPSEVALLERRAREPGPAPRPSHGDGGDRGGGDDRDRGDGGRGRGGLCPRCRLHPVVPELFDGTEDAVCVNCVIDDINAIWNDRNG